MVPVLLLFGVLTQVPDGGTAEPRPAVEQPAPEQPVTERPELAPVAPELSEPPDAGAPKADEGLGIKVRGAAELAVEVMPSGPPGGGYDGFIALHPVFSFSASDDFQVVLGPRFRFRLVDSPPLQRATDFGGVLRGEDWDTTSDFGQIVESLRIAPDTSPFLVRAGAVRKKTLGLGHLINRYSNSENPDYHPAAGTAVMTLGPVRGEFFASDIFAGRILAGDLAWDLGATFSRAADVGGRYVLALEVVHDMGLAGMPRVPAACAAADATCAVLDRSRLSLTLLGLDGSVVLLRQEKLKLMLLAAFGSRANADADLGLALGGAADVTAGEVAISLKLELRKQNGGFRQGLVGPTYELSRFAGLGFSGAPLVEEHLPDGWSLYAEARPGSGYRTQQTVRHLDDTVSQET